MPRSTPPSSTNRMVPVVWARRFTLCLSPRIFSFTQYTVSGVPTNQAFGLRVIVHCFNCILHTFIRVKWASRGIAWRSQRYVYEKFWVLIEKGAFEGYIDRFRSKVVTWFFEPCGFAYLFIDYRTSFFC